jgi:hypothetical protein
MIAEPEHVLAPTFHSTNTWKTVNVSHRNYYKISIGVYSVHLLDLIGNFLSIILVDAVSVTPEEFDT